jgi:uncharacterized protein (DUF1501 family)
MIAYGWCLTRLNLHYKNKIGVNMKNNESNERRDFIKKMVYMGAGVYMSTVPLNASETNGSYRAVVNVFLNGGNDSMNMLVPRSDPEYNKYKDLRNKVAIDQRFLIPLKSNGSSIKYGLHPRLKKLAQLYNNDKIAFVANVGTLYRPTSKDNLLVPKALNAHDRQMMFWQTCNFSSSNKIGWAGKAVDVLREEGYCNDTLISYSLNRNTWQIGRKGKGFSLSSSKTTSVEALKGRSERVELRKSYFRSLLSSTNNHFTNEYSKLVNHSIDTSKRVFSEVNDAKIETKFGGDTFSKSLKLIAKLIQKREALGNTKQIFYVELLGFDTHAKQSPRLNKLYKKLDSSLSSFNQAMNELHVDDKVTTVISSEFGRRADSNSNSTAHGWGGHYFVMGGSVKGGKIYGEMPKLARGSKDLTKKTAKVARNLLIPTLSVEQYMMPVLKWLEPRFTEDDLRNIFVNYNKFEYTEDTNFMKS